MMEFAWSISLIFSCTLKFDLARKPWLKQQGFLLLLFLIFFFCLDFAFLLAESVKVFCYSFAVFLLFILLEMQYFLCALVLLHDSGDTGNHYLTTRKPLLTLSFIEICNQLSDPWKNQVLLLLDLYWCYKLTIGRIHLKWHHIFLSTFQEFFTHYDFLEYFAYEFVSFSSCRFLLYSTLLLFIFLVNDLTFFLHFVYHYFNKFLKWFLLMLLSSLCKLSG